MDQQDEADRIDKMIDEFEEAAIEYREYACGETGKRYDAARETIANAILLA